MQKNIIYQQKHSLFDIQATISVSFYPANLFSQNQYFCPCLSRKVADILKTAAREDSEGILFYFKNVIALGNWVLPGSGGIKVWSLGDLLTPSVLFWNILVTL